MKTVNIMPKLKELIETPFEDKLALTNFIIDKHVSELGDDLVVAWSGGKDSTLVLWFVLKRLPRIKVIFNNTGIEYLDTITFIREMTVRWSLNLIETKPAKTFFQCVDEYGWPRGKSNRTDHKSDRCCYYLKEKPANDIYKQLKVKGVFSGITAVENRNRQFGAIKRGTCFQPKKHSWLTIQPILYWTENEVRQFHTDNNIPLNGVYSKGCDRCGCSCCTAFLSWESQLSRMNPKLYEMVKLRRDKQYVMKES